jgi:hypothetical protein
MSYLEQPALALEIAARDRGLACRFQREVVVSDLDVLTQIQSFLPLRKRRALYGRYHPTFSDVRAAIQDVEDSLSTKYADGLATLMTVKIFQQFEGVSLPREIYPLAPNHVDRIVHAKTVPY